MKIIIITDAWLPQVNGVVRTLTTTIEELKKLGHEVNVIEPSIFSSFPFPFYKEIPIVYNIYSIEKYIKPPCAIHIATEGSLGLTFNWYCQNNNIPFTTSYHTNYPAYLKKYLGIPEFISYGYLKFFHNSAKKIMTASLTLENKLKKRGFENIVKWSRGVDINLFKPSYYFQEEIHEINTIECPSILYDPSYCLYVGRVAKEKNIEAFLNIKNIKKIVVGDGPYLSILKKKYPEVIFLGALHGKKLAEVYARASCFVFPSKTDTFGLVLLEALASGVPIAGYPVEGPIDIWNKDPKTGCLNKDLETAVINALKYGEIPDCRRLAMQYSWENCTKQFLNNLVIYE